MKIDFLQRVLDMVKEYKHELRGNAPTVCPDAVFPPVAVLAGAGLPTPKNVIYQVDDPTSPSPSTSFLLK